jgi:hypothetical protein
MADATGRYRKVRTAIWSNADFLALDEATKLDVFYLLTGPQTNRIGLYRLSPAGAAEDLGTSIETFRERLGNVCQTFGWTFDATARVLWIPSWWKFNPPENANVLKGCLADLADVPQTPLASDFADNIDPLPPALHETFRQRLPKRLGKRLAIQEQEQEQEQEQKQELGARAAPSSTKANDTREDVTVILERFERFWSRYPRQEGREPAWKAYLDISPTDAHAAEILAGVERFRLTKSVTDALASGDCSYVTLAKNWLRETRWQDVSTPNAGRPAVKLVCHHKHQPPCQDAVACSSRYLREMQALPTAAPTAEVHA